jgi:hypothetical protein
LKKTEQETSAKAGGKWSSLGLCAAILLGLFFYPEDRSKIFLLNAC